MRPQDIVILLKILCYGNKSWYSKTLAQDLNLSTAEISSSLNRSVHAGLLEIDKKKIRKQALLEFIIHGLQYVFPQRPGGIARGLATAVSHPYIKKHFVSEQQYVWPDAASDEKGLSLQPLYVGMASAAEKDEKLYLMLALIDVLRTGKTRERKFAIKELENLINS